MHKYTGWIDREACQENATECLEVGGRVGEVTIEGQKPAEACRGLRSNFDDRIRAYYSSETCGNLDFREPFPLNLVDRTFRVLVLEEVPWVQSINPLKRNPRYKELSGFHEPMVEFWFEMLKEFPGSRTVSFGADAIGNTSRGLYPNSIFNAAVHDVAIGHYDAVVSNIYLTLERAKVVKFLPVIGTGLGVLFASSDAPASMFPADYFYLVVPLGEVVEESSWEVLKKTFAPFNTALWLSIIFFFFVAATVFMVCAGPDEEDFHNEPTYSAAMHNYVKSAYLSFSGPKER